LVDVEGSTALRISQGDETGHARWYAHMLLDRNASDDREKARQLLTEAIDMYRRLGMPKHVEMAETMLREG
jgi:hypothetical protein